MTLKKITGKVHLWLGLTSGLIVFIISITGCLYAFQEEIQDATQPYRFTTPRNLPYRPPSELAEIGKRALPGKHLHAVAYEGNDRTAQAIFYNFDPSYYYIVYLDPYTGVVQNVKDMDASFFRIVLDGHFYLWLPPEIGQPVVASATLIFVIMLISGLVLWWPRNKSAVKQRFSVRWSAKWQRKNYDLHNVLGFYSTWVLLILAATGLVWGFQWFAGSVYAVAGGDKSLLYVDPVSDKSGKLLSKAEMPAVDKVFELMKKEYPDARMIEVHPPETDSSAIAANANTLPGTYWKMDYRYFDQYSLKELSVDHIYGRIHEASAADKLMRMNYDIHTGAIIGLPGKILAFFVSLIAASLPVTGFLIWYQRKYRKKPVRSAGRKSSRLRPVMNNQA